MNTEEKWAVFTLILVLLIAFAALERQQRAIKHRLDRIEQVIPGDAYR